MKQHDSQISSQTFIYRIDQIQQQHKPRNKLNEEIKLLFRIAWGVALATNFDQNPKPAGAWSFPSYSLYQHQLSVTLQLSWTVTTKSKTHKHIQTESERDEWLTKEAPLELELELEAMFVDLLSEAETWKRRVFGNVSETFASPFFYYCLQLFLILRKSVREI